VAARALRRHRSRRLRRGRQVRWEARGWSLWVRRVSLV
jgi:hypothetical protein